MSLLQKLGLVEEVPSDSVVVSTEYDIVDDVDVVEAELESVNVDTLIDDIYAQNELADKSSSIFKVEELIASLPKEMVTDTKRNSVLAILGSFNLTATDVTTDGEERVKVLSAIKQQVTEATEISTADKEMQIEELKKQIAALTVEIANEREQTRISSETIDKEVSKIEELVKFIGGVN